MNLMDLVDDVRLTGKHIERKEDIAIEWSGSSQAIVARDPSPPDPDWPFAAIALDSSNHVGARRAQTVDDAAAHARRLVWRLGERQRAEGQGRGAGISSAQD